MTAGSDPPSPDDPGASRPRSGPAEVPHALVVAARNGDAAAFARLVKHWDTHLRPFVHHTLAGDGSTDRVLSAAYVRAYRALPRYRAAQSPGLWLHRIAYLAAVDELRRLTRDPRRRTARARPVAAPGRPEASLPALSPVAQALRDLAPDQRAIAVMVDLEKYRPTTVAGAFDTGASVVSNRLGAARRAIAAADPAALPEQAPQGQVSAPRTFIKRTAQDAPQPTTGPVPPDVRATETGPDAPAVTPVADALGGVLLGGNWRGASAPPVTTGPGAVRPGHPVNPPSNGGGSEVGVAQRPGASSPDDDFFAIPLWADESITLLTPESDPPGTVLEPELDQSQVLDGVDGAPAVSRAEGKAEADARLATTVGTALADLPVPPPAEGFWTELGHRLITERERPAAPTPDPVARLARAHPAELGFRPSQPPLSVSTLATRAGQNRPRRRWGRPLALFGAVLVIAGVVAAAVVVGISGKPPDGSVTGTQLANTLARALDGSRYLRVEVVVEEPASDTGGNEPQRHRLTLGDDGSWMVTRTDAYDETTYDGTRGELRRVVTVPGEGGASPVTLVAVDLGLAAGKPDPAAEPSGLLADLRTVGTLLRADGTRRAAATRVGGVATWTYRRTVATGEAGADEVWQVTIRRSDGLPMRIERRRNNKLVRGIRFSGWEPASEVPVDTFKQVLPQFIPRSVNVHGFVPVDLPGVAIVGRGPAVTPAWLPDGFDLGSVAVLAEAPAGTSTTGGGTNPPDVGVMSLGYQRGPERITVTTRGTTAPEGDWRDPFATKASDAGSPRRRTLGDGRFNQAPVSIGTDAVGRAQLWGIDDDTVFTVGGDLTPADAFRVASSLR